MGDSVPGAATAPSAPHVGLGDKTAAGESALHLASDELATQALFELLHPNAFAAQQTFVKRRVRSAIALK